ncbi:protein translocase subunit SecF [Candidatus Uhrbacteria bacterium]|nr:protein translocase subunit SecF [Candidatus Uhrbacteria bacterium]
MQINIIKHRKTWLVLSALMIVAGIVALSIWQLKLGIDYTGGTLLEVSYQKDRPSTQEITSVLAAENIKDAEIKFSGDTGVIMRFKTIDEDTHQNVLAKLKKQDANLLEKSFESIGPVIGHELKSKSLLAIALALILIMAYITFVFRRVSFPVPSWQYGATAIIALFHDLIFVLGIFAVLGVFRGVEITSSFIPAFLTVLGFSVHDTIVVFDRVRENLLKYKGAFAEIVSKSLNETLVRSINTSLTVMLVLAAIYVFGGESLKTFSLALLLGIGVGTYSSLFFASPLLVAWHEWSARRK